MRICLLFALALTLFAQSSAGPDTSARRLNRYEYNATVRDLLATSFQPAADFPVDDSGYGFDNMAAVLSLSPALMEKYLAAAEKIAKAAIVPPTAPMPSVQRYAARDFRLKVDFEADYDILIAVHGSTDSVQAEFLIDGVPAATLPIDDAAEGLRSGQFRLHLGRGNPELTVELTPSTAGLRYVEIRGPYNPVPPPLPESYAKVFRCGHAPGHHTLSCARTNLADLAQRAYRRPVTDQEVDGLVHFVEMAQQQGDSIDQGMQVALEAILVSPRFLFRIEPAGATSMTSNSPRASPISFGAAFPTPNCSNSRATIASAIRMSSAPRSTACCSTPNRAHWSRTSAANGLKRATLRAFSQIPISSLNSTHLCATICSRRLSFSSNPSSGKTAPSPISSAPTTHS